MIIETLTILFAAIYMFFMGFLAGGGWKWGPIKNKKPTERRRKSK